MTIEDLTKGDKIQLPIVKEKSYSKFYYVRTDDGHEFRIRKLKWQIDSKDMPDILDCYVREIHNGVPFIAQDIQKMIPRFYTPGEQYKFKVASPWGNVAGCYSIKDDYGLSFMLHNAPVNLRTGATVECSVIRISGCDMTLKYRGQLSNPLNLNFLDLSGWLSAIDVPKHDICHLCDYYERYMRDHDEFAEAMQEYDNKSPNWTFSAISAFTEHIPLWLEQTTDYESRSADKKRNRNFQYAEDIMANVIRICQYIVEDSDYLKGCNLDQRVDFRDRLTLWIELLKQYSHAVRMLRDDSCEQYIEDIFRRLRESGNLYHPSKRFRIMMTIFRLRPSLIVKRMGELFEILHKWESGNWQVEPFRGTLVSQLQLFISELSGLVDNIATNETGSDNKLLVQMILAIAIQSLLARDCDDIDLKLNRARLYRYMSCLNLAKADTLLGKAVESILGLSFGKEFNWTDTGLNPSLLIEKTSVAANNTEDSGNTITLKRFTSGVATVELRQDSVRVIGRDADPEAVSLPNGTVPWMGATVSVADDIPTRRKKDLRTLREMWNDVERSLFAPDQACNNLEHTTPMRRPEHREKVYVKIDNAEIYRSLKSSEPMLRFHCVIQEDSIYGEGWMMAHPNAFVPWLSARDVDCGFYDMSLDFARDSNGDPLLFKVTAMVNGDDLQFSMREQLDDYFIDIAPDSSELLAFITTNDRQTQQAIIGVTELGYSIKLPFSDKTQAGEEGYLDTDSLQPGDVVRVRRIQRYNSSNYQEGEILESIPGKRIPKSDLLRSLFHELGISMSDNDYEISEVTEAEENMTREELYELAQLFRRKGCLEPDFHVAFNLLAYARILALCGGAESLARDIRTHQDLLWHIEYFAINRHVDPSQLNELDQKVRGIQMLERLYRRISILSVIGHPENNPQLWNNLEALSDENRRIASLVVSYNLLPKEELGDEAKKILERIAQHFNVTDNTPNLKYYGQEGPRVEFKSSIVFTNRKADHMQPRHDEQLHEILQIICGFMNYEGGTLYIGVNDAGYETGLSEDLDFFRRIRPHGFPRQTGSNPSLDNIQVYLTNVLNQKLPAFSTNMGKIEIDEQSRKGVLAVTINPSRVPVFLDNVLFARDSSSTTARTGKRLEDFLATRERNYDLYVREIQMQQNDTDVAEVDAEEEVDVKQIIVPDNRQKDSFEKNYSADKPIATGCLRNNVVDEWEPDYSEPEYIIHFYGRDCWKLTSKDVYEKDNTRLRLAVHRHETDYLAICIDNDGRISAIQLERLDPSSKEKEKKSHALENMRFILLGSPKDSLLCVIRNAAGKFFYRLVQLSDITKVQKFETEGATIIDQPHTIVGAEILTPERCSEYEKGRDMKREHYGVPLRTNLNESPEEALSRFLAEL